MSKKRKTDDPRYEAINSFQPKITNFFKSDCILNPINNNNNIQASSSSQVVGTFLPKIVGKNSRDAIYINARSVIANLSKIESMCKSLKPNLIVCSESRITIDINANEYDISGYNCEVCHSPVVWQSMLKNQLSMKF